MHEVLLVLAVRLELLAFADFRDFVVLPAPREIPVLKVPLDLAVPLVHAV